MTNAANRFAASVGLPFRLPTRLAVGFGLEALPALAGFTPDGGKPSLAWFPRSSAPRIRPDKPPTMVGGEGECIDHRANVNGIIAEIGRIRGMLNVYVE